MQEYLFKVREAKSNEPFEVKGEFYARKKRYIAESISIQEVTPVIYEKVSGLARQLILEDETLPVLITIERQKKSSKTD